MQEWVLIVSLFSTQDVFLEEHKTKKECGIALKEFKKLHKNDANVRMAECEMALIVDDEIIVTKRIP
jgi:hypothetical protein